MRLSFLSGAAPAARGKGGVLFMLLYGKSAAAENRSGCRSKEKGGGNSIPFGIRERGAPSVGMSGRSTILSRKARTQHSPPAKKRRHNDPRRKARCGRPRQRCGHRAALGRKNAAEAPFSTKSKHRRAMFPPIPLKKRLSRRYALYPRRKAPTQHSPAGKHGYSIIPTEKRGGTRLSVKKQPAAPVSPPSSGRIGTPKPTSQSYIISAAYAPKSREASGGRIGSPAGAQSRASEVGPPRLYAPPRLSEAASPAE